MVLDLLYVEFDLPLLIRIPDLFGIRIMDLFPVFRYSLHTEILMLKASMLKFTRCKPNNSNQLERIGIWDFLWQVLWGLEY